MKEIAALLTFLFFSGLAIFLAVRKHIGTTLTVILLLFSLISGLVMASHDRFSELTWPIALFAPFQGELTRIKEESLWDFRKEAESDKQSLSLLVSAAKALHDGTEAQKKLVESALEAAKRLEEKATTHEQKSKEMSDKAEEVRAQTLAIYEASSELALLLTKVVWLQMEAKNEANGPRSEVARQRVMDQLDEIVNLVIPDPDARSRFVSDVMNSVPRPQ